MDVLFVGGTGTISTACSHLCAERGFDLTVLVRGNRDHRLPDEIEVLHGDIKEDPQGVRDLLEGRRWDCVVDWICFDEQDARRDLDLFEDRTDRFVFVSSTAVYERPLPVDPVTEAHPIGNTGWSYAEDKVECERFFRQAHEERGFPVVIARPGHTYAPFVLPTGIAGLGIRLVEWIRRGRPVPVHDGGRNLWTLTFNRDIARGLVPLLKAPNVEGEAFHLATDESHTWREIYETMGRVFDLDVDLVSLPAETMAEVDDRLGATVLHDKAHDTVFDLSKLRDRVPSFEPRVSLEDGLAACRRWYEANAEDVDLYPDQEKLLERLVARAEPLQAGRRTTTGD